MKKYSSMYNSRILSYCLMGNHVHIVSIPESRQSIPKTIGVAHNQYSISTHLINDQTGHLWQERYYSCPMDDTHLVAAMRYVEQNPVRAGIISNPLEYRWSSALAHVTGIDKNGILDMQWWKNRFDSEYWIELLNINLHDEQVILIRDKTYRGQPLGDEKFKKWIFNQH